LVHPTVGCFRGVVRVAVIGDSVIGEVSALECAITLSLIAPTRWVGRERCAARWLAHPMVGCFRGVVRVAGIGDSEIVEGLALKCAITLSLIAPTSIKILSQFRWLAYATLFMILVCCLSTDFGCLLGWCG
jgi:hypothetical protein